MGRKKREERNRQLIANGELKRVAEDDDGNPIFQHPSGNGLVLHDGRNVGSGAMPPYGTPESREIAQAQRKALEARRMEKIAEYEAEVSEALMGIASLQKMVVEVAQDQTRELTANQIQQMKLGLAGAENILNRVMGRPKQQTELKVQSTVFEEMTRIADDWELDAEDVEEINE